jgi:hypothetical protein
VTKLGLHGRRVLSSEGELVTNAKEKNQKFHSSHKHKLQ